MRVINKNDTKTPMPILLSFEDFKLWYLSCCDFSIFSESDIRELLSEEQPDDYPCIPLVLEDDYRIIYLGLDLVKQWTTLHLG